MAEVFYFHVQEDRSIKYKLPEPIMQEDKDVATWRFRIPKVLNNIDMSAWSWWFVYVNAKGQEYSELLTLTDDIDEPASYSTADYDIDYGISKFPGSFSFALEAISTEQGSEISGEWHTRTYSHKVDKTLQGNQAEYAETESDVISALMQEVRNKVNQLVGGATPLPVNLKSLMTDHDKVYLYTGSEDGEQTGYWYYWNGVRFTPGGVYGAGDPESVQGYVENWLDNHPEATTTVQDGAITKTKLNAELYKAYLRTESAMHFFPSLESGGYSGNSSLMVVKDKCVLFDCGPTVNWDAIKAFYDALYADGIFANIDYIVISHYHWDHVQNLANILERYPHAGCIAYLPLNPAGYTTAEIGENRTTVINALQTYGVTYHEISQDTEFDVLDGFCTIALFNSTPADYAYYQDTTPDVYNNFCMCALVKTGEVYSLYPGDIQRQAHIRICDTRDIPKLVLYVTHHHAIQNDDYIPYLDMIEPEFAVIQTSYARQLISAASSFAANYACEHVYSCAYGSCVVAIGKDGGSVVDGRELSKTGWYYSYIDYYVDNTYTGTEHYGTEGKPFTDINEALMFVKGNLNLNYRIYVKATAQPYAYTWIRDLKQSIEIIGVSDGSYTNPIVDGIYIKNSSDVTLNKISVTGAGREVNGINTLLYVLSSFTVLQNCIINDSGSTFDNGVLINNGSVYVSGCTFKKLTNAFSTYRWGTAISNTNTFNDCTTPYLANNLNLYIRNIDTVSNCTNYIYVSGVGAKPVTFPSLTSAANVTALSALVALNSGRVLSRPFDCNGRMAVVRDNSIVYRDALSDTGTTISSNTNLNSLTAFGKYYCGNSSTAQSLSNCPASIGFTLFVERNAATYTRQTVYDNEGNMFIRTLTSGGTWNAWKTVTLT